MINDSDHQTALVINSEVTLKHHDTANATSGHSMVTPKCQFHYAITPMHLPEPGTYYGPPIFLYASYFT
jgi:hypothetical protein